MKAVIRIALAAPKLHRSGTAEDSSAALIVTPNCLFLGFFFPSVAEIAGAARVADQDRGRCGSGRGVGGRWEGSDLGE